MKLAFLGAVALFISIWAIEPVHAQARPAAALRRSVERFLSAVENNDLGRLRLLMTKRGSRFVVRALNNHKEAGKILNIISTANAASRIRWTEVIQSVARGKVRWVAIQFVFEQGKWKFDAV